MDLESIDWVKAAQAAAAIIGVLVGAAGFIRGSSGRLSRLADEVEVLTKMPEKTPARQSMQQLVDRHAANLAGLDEGTRDWPMLVVSLIVMPVSAYFAIGLGFNGEWWGVLSGIALGLTALMFTYGIFETAAKVPRDSKGHRIQSGGAG